MTTAAIPIVVWIAWAITGFCGGYMTSRLTIKGHYRFLMSLIGIAGGVGGGGLFIALAGHAVPEKAELLSLLCSLAGTALFVWLAAASFRRTLDNDDENRPE